MMTYVPNDSLDPRFNLALEEYILRDCPLDGPCLLLWRNSPSVIIGRFQNTLDEINPDYIAENGVNVVRRITGGGAVYHDLGNLNFSFIERAPEDGINLRMFTDRVAVALRRMGLDVGVSGRNDLTIDCRKFSGNAQYRYKDRVLHHGTILYDSNLENVQAALNVKAEKMASKGVRSVRARVTNLSAYMPRPIPILEFRDSLLGEFLRDEQASGPSIRHLDERDMLAVRRLIDDKYSTWDWNFGRSPEYNLKGAGRFACGSVEAYLKVERGVIQSCRIYGDFFADEDISGLEAGLVGTGYAEADLREAYGRLGAGRYIPGMGIEDFLRLLLLSGWQGFPPIPRQGEAEECNHDR